MKTKKIFIIIMALFYSITSANLFASSFGDTFGFSAEGIARGNAMTASVNDWSSVYYNVAGLGKTRNLVEISSDPEMNLKLQKEEGAKGDRGEKFSYPNQFAIGLLYVFPRMKLSINRYLADVAFPLKTNAAKMDSYGFITLGGVLDINTIIKMPEFISSARLGVGMGLNSDFSLANINDIDPRTHDFLRHGNEIRTATILIGLGLGLVNDAIGGGIGVNLAFSGKASAYMDAQITGNIQIPIADTSMKLKIVPGVITGIYLSPGKMINTFAGLEIGISYRQETMLKIDPFKAAAGILGGVVEMNMMLSIQDYYSPHVVNGGIAYTRGGVTLSYDLSYEMWARNTLSMVWKTHYSGIPKLKNILLHKAGIKYDTPLGWLAVMAGYSFVPSILGSDAGTKIGIRVDTVGTKVAPGMYNYLDNAKHNVSFGFTFTVPQVWRLTGKIVITTSYQLQYLVPKSVPKTGISYSSGVQDDMVQSYFLNPRYRYGGINHGMFIEVGMKI
jgi:hypothetical protein